MRDNRDQIVSDVESLSKLMDSQFKIPGVPMRLGLDTLIGLIPGIGDTIGLGVSGYIIAQSARLGLPKRRLLQMSFNVGIDWLIGLIPLIGDLFDWGWKANLRNAKILRDYVDKKAHLNAEPREL